MTQPYTYWEKQKQIKKLVQIFEKSKVKHRNLNKQGVKNDNFNYKRSTNLSGVLDEVGCNPFKITIGFTETSDTSIKC